MKETILGTQMIKKIGRLAVGCVAASLIAGCSPKPASPEATKQDAIPSNVSNFAKENKISIEQDASLSYSTGPLTDRVIYTFVATHKESGQQFLIASQGQDALTMMALPSPAMKTAAPNAEPISLEK